MAAIHAPQHAPQHLPHGGPRHVRERTPQIGLLARGEAQPASRPYVCAGPQRDARAAPPYGRRRLLVLLALTVMVVGLVVAVETLAGGDGKPGIGDQHGQAKAITGEVYVVQPGDNLWSIAERLAPGGDPRQLVRELRERHGGVEVDVGDRVSIDGLGD
jgi:hypothetical protein